MNSEDELTVQKLQETIDQWVKTYGVRYFSELTNLADELADILFVLVCIANQTGVDLTAAVRKNLGKKTARDRERHRNNPKLA